MTKPSTTTTAPTINIDSIYSKSHCEHRQITRHFLSRYRLKPMPNVI